MKSTLGRRALICKELGWSLEFVEHGISYIKLQMMIADMPHVVGKDKDGDVTRIELTDDNAEEVMRMMVTSSDVIEE